MLVTITRSVSLLAGLVTLSCMETLPSTIALPPTHEVAVLRAANGASPLRTEFVVTHGIARGHLAWADNCRRVELVRPREQEIVTTTPSYEAATAAGMGALGTGVLGTALLNNLDQFSTKEKCSLDDDGNESCSSPRDDATAGGVLLVGTALALTAASLVTVASPSSTTYGDVHTGDARRHRVLAERENCGEGSVAGVALSLYLAEERIATSATDEHGDIAFAIPSSVTGTLTLAVDSVPSKYRTLSPGQVVGAVRVEPEGRSVPDDW